MFASSGSGAMESAVANLVRAGEPALVASCGKFGERWAELCDAYGADTIHWETEWGRRVDPAELDRRLADEPPASRSCSPRCSETSTGVVNDVRELTEVAHRHGALIAVDAVSAIGAVPAAAGRVGRRRGRGGLPEGADGAARARRSPAPTRRRSSAPRRVPGRRHYFDWAAPSSGQRKDPPDSPFTPAVGLVQALDVALGLIEEEGLDAVYERHRLLGRATREAARALDLELLGEPDDNANVVTAIRLPESIDGAKVPPADARPLRRHDRRRPGRGSRARSPASPTAATSARSTSWSRSPPSR